MDLQTLNRAERQSTLTPSTELSLLRERVQQLESDKHTLVRSAGELRKQLEQALETQSGLMKTLAGSQASEQSLRTLNVMLESQVRAGKAEVETYKVEISSLTSLKRSAECDLSQCQESLIHSKRDLLTLTMREQMLRIELDQLRNAHQIALIDSEKHREELAGKGDRLVGEWRERERGMKGEIERLRGEVAEKTKESDQRWGVVVSLTEKCDELAAKLALSSDEHHQSTLVLTDQLSQKDEEISTLKARSGVLPLLSFPTESKEQVSFLMDKLTELQVKYARAASKADTFEKQLRLLLEEVEAKAPILAKQKVNYEELCEAYATLRAEVEIGQKSEEQNDVSSLRDKLTSETRDNDHLRQEVSTLSLQVRTLLIEIHRIRYGGDPTSLPASTFRSLEDLQRENQRLNAELRSAKGREGNEDLLEAAREELAAQRETIEQLTKRIQVSEDLLAQGYVPVARMTQVTADRMGKENQLRLQVDSLQKDLSFERDKVHSFESFLRDSQSECLTLRKDLNSTKQSLATTHSQVAQLSSDLASSQLTINKLQSDLMDSRRETNSVKERCAGVEFEAKRLGEQWEVGAASEGSLKIRLVEMEKAHREAMDKFIAERETIYSQWRAREQDLTDTKKRWRDEVTRLKADLENLKAELQSGRALSDLHDSPELIQSRLQLSELKTAYLDLEETHTGLLRRFEEVTEEHARTVEEVQRLSDRYQTYRLRERCGMLQEEVDGRTIVYYETLISMREQQAINARLLVHLREATAKITDLEDSLAREKALYLQEVSHTSQLHTTAIQQLSRLDQLESELRTIAGERDALKAEISLKEKEWSEAQSISSGNFQYIREFQQQLGNIRREKVELEVKYRELTELLSAERSRLTNEKSLIESQYQAEIVKLEGANEAVRGENNQLRETLANSGKGLDPAARKTLGRLVELHHRLLRLKP